MKLSTMDKGGLLAVANVITVAAIAALVPDTLDAELARFDSPSVFGMIIASTMLPSLFVGALLAKISSSMHGPRRVRRVVMGALAGLAVLLFGLTTSFHSLIPLAAVPTLLWTACLERWTRPRYLSSTIRFT